MGNRDYATPIYDKSYNVYCQRCGLKYKASECVIETDLRGRGLFVCRVRCFDGEHPQDFVRGVPDWQAVPRANPQDGSIPTQAADVPPTDTVQEIDEIIGV